MVLKAFWGSLVLLLGALGALLGVSWELLRASGSTKEGLQIRFGTLLGLVCSRSAAEDGLGNVVGRVQLVRNLLGSILTSQTNPCLLYTSPSPRDATLSRMPSSA